MTLIADGLIEERIFRGKPVPRLESRNRAVHLRFVVSHPFRKVREKDGAPSFVGMPDSRKQGLARGFLFFYSLLSQPAMSRADLLVRFRRGAVGQVEAAAVEEDVEGFL